MTPKQVEQELKQALLLQERLASLLKSHAKIYADRRYRNTKDVTDLATLIKLTSEAQAVETFINSIVAHDLDRRPNKE